MLADTDFVSQRAETTNAQFNARDLLYALEHDGEMWLQFTLAEHLVMDIPQFHLDGVKHLCNMTVSRIALAWPRGHAKTTIVKSVVVWHWCFTRVRFIIYASNTSPIAKNACTDIINIVNGENFAAVFGQVEWVQKNESEGIWKFYLYPGDPEKRKLCILRSLGAGQQVRGMNIDNLRPELLVADDMEDIDNTNTPENRLKLTRWVRGPLFKAMNQIWSKIIWIGNLLHKEGILARICESSRWHSSKLGCLIEEPITRRIKPLWEEVWPLGRIREDLKEWTEDGMMDVWYAEMMNIIVNKGKRLIEAEDIDYLPVCVPRQQKFGFITIDPAISKKTWADDAAIAVHIFTEDYNRWQIAEVVAGKLGVDGIYRDAMDLAEKWGIELIGIESTAYQAALKWIFDYLNATTNRSHIEIVQLTASSQKAIRIAGFCGLLKHKEYALPEGDLQITQQLFAFDPTTDDNRDDIIDTCAYGDQMISEHMDKILEHKQIDELGVVRSEIDVCEV